MKSLREVLSNCAKVTVVLFIVAACEQQPIEQDTQSPKPPRDQYSIRVYESKGIWDILTCFGTLLAAICAAISANYSFKVLRQADETQRSLRIEARRQRIADIWQELNKITWLTPEQEANPNTEETSKIVLDNVNAMGKVGLLWFYELIDRDILETEFAKAGYLRLFDQINSLGLILALNRTGKQLLDENPNAKALYDAIKRRFPP